MSLNAIAKSPATVATKGAAPLTKPEAPKAMSAPDTLKLSRPVASKPQAQGAGETVVKAVATVFGTSAGAVGGAMLGWAGWFFANAAGTALSSNVIGVGVLAGAALGAWAGWERGKFIVEAFKRLSQAS